MIINQYLLLAIVTLLPLTIIILLMSLRKVANRHCEYVNIVKNLHASFKDGSIVSYTLPVWDDKEKTWKVSIVMHQPAKEVKIETTIERSGDLCVINGDIYVPKGVSVTFKDKQEG